MYRCAFALRPFMHGSKAATWWSSRAGRLSFEITEVAGKPMSGLMKDVVSVGRRSTAAVDFVANNPGLTLFHCHMQLHMDFGFMQLLEYTA
jgi:FtsP/CotA-like multicopper oxidase with cupredoxin domain